MVATALLDCLLHHAVVIQIEGSSYRLRQHANLMPEQSAPRRSSAHPSRQPFRAAADDRQNCSHSISRPADPETGEFYFGTNGENSFGIDSRRLERETQRNIELMWLTGRLMPDFKTIADFRRDNGATIRAVCSQFVALYRQLGLFTRAVVAIDGSKFKAVNNRDMNCTVAKVTGRMEQVNASIASYLRALDQADRAESDIAEAKSGRLKEKIAGLRRQMQALKAMEQTVQDAPDQQVSLTDPDAVRWPPAAKAPPPSATMFKSPSTPSTI